MKYKFIVKLWLILKYFQIQKTDADRMPLCGPKLSLCGVVLSAWGIVQLSMMGIFFYIRR